MAGGALGEILGRRWKDLRAAALELQGKARVTVVSPPWVTETLVAFKMDPSPGLPASEVAKAYVDSLEGNVTGKVIDARKAGGY